MDESRDRSSEKHVVFVVRYLDGYAVRTSFLQIEKMEDDKAKTMYDWLTSVFAAYNISTKKVCIASWSCLSVMLMVNSFRDSYLGINMRKAFERGGRAHSQNCANPIWKLTTVPIHTVTINNSQGHSEVGLDISIPAFTHGMLHVAVSGLVKTRLWYLVYYAHRT